MADDKKDKAEALGSVIERLTKLYLKDVIPMFVGKSGNESLDAVLIRNKKEFTAHILRDASISGDETKTKLLWELFSKTRYSFGVTTLIESIKDDIIPKLGRAYVDGYSSIRTFNLEVISDIDAYVNSKYVTKQPAARGKVLHYMVQALIIRDFSCYSPIPMKKLPEASDRVTDIPSALEKLVAEIQLAGFRFVALEFPVYYRRSPILKPYESTWRWLTGKIDVIAWHDEYGLCLMDFKFAELPGVRRRHALQLSLLALCLASMGIMVDSLFIISTAMGRNEYRCNIYTVSFSEELVRAAIVDNDYIKASFEQEDIITFKSLSSDLITKLASRIPTSENIIIAKHKLREKEKKKAERSNVESKQEGSAP